MRRGIVVLISVMGLILVVLAITLASVGTQFDQARVELTNLQFDVEDLQETVEGATEARDTLQRQVEEHLKTIEQLKAELERIRSSAHSASAAPTTTPTP